MKKPAPRMTDEEIRNALWRAHDRHERKVNAARRRGPGGRFARRAP